MLREGGFTTTRRTDDGYHLALAHGGGYVSEHGVAAESLVQMLYTDERLAPISQGSGWAQRPDVCYLMRSLLLNFFSSAPTADDSVSTMAR